MFHRILVPLDGSARAELAIPVAARIARASSGTIIFVRVVLPPFEVGAYSTEQRVETGVAARPTAYEKRLTEAEDYLHGVMTTFASQLSGLGLETEVITGAPVETLLSTAHLDRADLVVMCSHGDTGIRRWIFQSVAEHTMRRSPIPVLVLSEHGMTSPFPKADHPLRILVALDGSALAEYALWAALQLVIAPTTLHLFTVIDFPSLYKSVRTITPEDQEVREQTTRRATAYLESVARRVREQAQGEYPVTVMASAVASVDVPAALLGQAELPSDTGEYYHLLAMATHGRSGFSRLIMGSVTEQLLGAAKLPLLVVHPTEEAKEESPLVTWTATSLPLW